MASIANALQVEAWCPTCEASTTHVQSEDEDYYEECDNADC